MAGQNITKAQMLDLLGRLANDDEFRTLFQSNPNAALLLVGIPRDRLPRAVKEHILPTRIGTKSEFEAARKRIVDQDGEECLCMIIPGLRLDFGDYK